MRVSLKWQRFMVGLGWTAFNLFFVVKYRVQFKGNLAWWEPLSADSSFCLSTIVTLSVLVDSD
jgi:hypothetical protein